MAGVNERKAIMKRSTAIHPETDQLLADAHALLSATARVAEEKVEAGAKATNKMIRDHPNQFIGLMLGVGALVGYLLGRRNR
jgi:ElaB/YqjD/DUF883 family membrane-anchored ribosome-binding protein